MYVYYISILYMTQREKERECVCMCSIFFCVEHSFIDTAEDTNQKENKVYIFF